MLQVAVIAELLRQSATIGSAPVVVQVTCNSSSLIPRENVFLGLDHIPLDQVVLHVHGITILKR